MTVPDLERYKRERKKVIVVTAYDALFDRYGVIRAEDFDEMFSTLLLFGEGKRAGKGGMAGSFCSCRPTSRLMYTGPCGEVCAICEARSNASNAAGTEEGWLSHLT